MNLDQLRFGQKVCVTSAARRYVGDGQGVHEVVQRATRGRYLPAVTDTLPSWPGAPVPLADGQRAWDSFVLGPPVGPETAAGEFGEFAPNNVRFRLVDCTSDEEGSVGDPLVGLVAGIVRRQEGSIHPGGSTGYEGELTEPYFSCQRRLALVEVLLQRPNLRAPARMVLAAPESINEIRVTTVDGFKELCRPGSHDASWTWEAEEGRLLRVDDEGLNALALDLQARGMLQPVRLGPDGRCWNGHHRVIAAGMIGLGYVEYEILP